MDLFQASAKENKFWSALVVGGTFGIFLTFGQAWSEFLRDLILLCVPEERNGNIIQSFTYCMVSTFICIFILYILGRCDKCVHGIYKKGKRFRTRKMFRNKSTGLKPKSIEQSKISQKNRIHHKSRDSMNRV